MYTNFDSVEDVIKSMDFNYNPNSEETKNKLQDIWNVTVGKKIMNLAKVYNISADNILTVVCSDSYTANELYYQKDKLLDILKERADEYKIEIKDIKFDYKKWKEKYE